MKSVVTKPMEIASPDHLKTTIFIGANLISPVAITSMADAEHLPALGLANYVQHVETYLLEHPSCKIVFGKQVHLDALAQKEQGHKIYVCANQREYRAYSGSENVRRSSPYGVICGSVLRQDTKNQIC